MRLCASLFRGVAALLGCTVLLPLLIQHDSVGYRRLEQEVSEGSVRVVL